MTRQEGRILVTTINFVSFKKIWKIDVRGSAMIPCRALHFINVIHAMFVMSLERLV